MATLQVDVVSAERSLFSGEVKFVALPGEVGELGILPGHTPLITRIRPGTVKFVNPQITEDTFLLLEVGSRLKHNRSLYWRIPAYVPESSMSPGLSWRGNRAKQVWKTCQVRTKWQ